MTRLTTMALATLVAMGLACAQPSNDGPVASDDPGQSQTGQPGSGRYDLHPDPTIRRLEEEAMRLARTDGCTRLDQCATAPVGNRACGGPRYYLPYCRLTTDTAALFARLEEVKRAEDEYNRRNQIVSTCEFRMPPDLELVGSTCRATVPR